MLVNRLKAAIAFIAERKGLAFAIPIALGIAIFVSAISLKSKPQQQVRSEHATKVRVIAAPSVTAVPRILGYGHAEPGKTWNGVAEVAGRIIWQHPDLKKGAIVPKGAELLRIDPTAYELALAQAEANIRSVDAQLKELTVDASNTSAALDIEARSLALAEKDLTRKRALLKKKAVSQASVDQEERTVLTRRLAVQNLRNRLNLLPSEREKLTAQRAVSEAQLADAKLDLERSVITAPFAGRVADVAIEQTQYAAANQVLTKLDSIATTEITAQVPIDKLIAVVAPSNRTGIVPETVMNSLPEILGIQPVVRLDSGTLQVEWPAKLSRISDTIDPKTRTVGVIVTVDDPYGTVRPGTRPPLSKNMFVEVELRGAPRPNTIVIPRVALNDGTVSIVSKENRLERRKVDVQFRQSNFVAVTGAISEGERVVVSDLVPAIDGMLLAPQPDPDARQALIDEAEGRTAVR